MQFRFCDFARLKLGAALALLTVSILNSAAAFASPIDNGGPVISGTPDVYFVWYGDWAGDSATTILPNFLNNLDGSSYLETETSMAGNGHVTLAGQTFVDSSSYSFGTNLNDTFNQIAQIALDAKALLGVSDPNAIFDVLTAPNIQVNGFTSNIAFCGYHDSTNFNTPGPLGTQFAFIGDPEASISGFPGLGNPYCYAQGPYDGLNSPNNNYGADAMASVIAHELIETVTDPTGLAWWDSQDASSTGGNENADMCAWNFGPTTTYLGSIGGNNSYANINLHGKNYLLQTQWNHTGPTPDYLGYNGGYCGIGANSALPTPEPLTISLFGAGLAGAVAIRRRRKTAH